MTDVTKIAEQFTEFLDTFHSYREPYDDKLDAWLHELYAKIKRKYQRLDFKSVYFSPSSANSCPRELYVKAKKARKDDEDVKPWRRRWTAQGTSLGDWLQREILLAERHFEKFTGEVPRFTMARTENNEPFFEDFVKTQRFIEHNGQRFSLLGTCDGVMNYVTDDGEILRVGLEIKSKQTTAAQTSLHSLREPKEDHVKQITCYSLMYDVDYYLIAYVNASKKAWNMTQEEYAKTPDVRVFGVEITDEMKREVLDNFAMITEAVATGEAPAMDIERFGFNNFKTACALDLNEEEVAEVKARARQALKSSLPDWKKAKYLDAYEFIVDARERANGEAV
jgi:hypothetical protein